MSSRILIVKVAGVTFEGRQEKLQYIRAGDDCRIEAEPDNPYDKNALAVWVAYTYGVTHVGYIPRDLAAQIAPYLEGEPIMARVLEVTGGFETQGGGTASLGLRIRVELPEFTNPANVT